MTIDMLYSKIHRANITDSNLDYEGSIGIDEDLLDASKIRVNQKVEILNVNNGERFSTYVIAESRKSGIVCINGAGARKVQKNDIIIIVAYASYDENEFDSHEPIVILLDENNKIKA